MRKELEMAQRELREMKERKTSLERECVIYQSQLEVVCFANVSKYCLCTWRDVWEASSTESLKGS